MGLIRRAATEILRSLTERPEQPVQASPKGDIENTVATIRAEFAAQLEYLQSQVAFYKRRSEDYFVLIEKMQTQRDEWRDIHLAESRGHQGAQVLLQEALTTARQYLGMAIMKVNEYRREKGEQPLVSTEQLAKMDVKAPPVGLAEATQAHNERVLAAAAPLLDGVAERTEIDVALGDPPAPPEASGAPPTQNT